MVSSFDEFKMRIWEIIEEVERECDRVTKEVEVWKGELQEVSRGLGRCIGKVERREVSKVEIVGYMERRSKVGKEIGEAVDRVNEVRGKLDKLLRENVEVAMSGSLTEKVLLASGVDSLDSMYVKLVSDRVEWLKGYGIGLMDFLKVWARKRDEIEAYPTVDGFEGPKIISEEESLSVENVVDAIVDFETKKRYEREEDFEWDLGIWCEAKFGSRNVRSQYGVERSRIDLVVGGVGIELKVAGNAEALKNLRGQLAVYKKHFGNKLIAVVLLSGVDVKLVAELRRDMRKEGIVVIEKRQAS